MSYADSPAAPWQYELGPLPARARWFLAATVALLSLGLVLLFSASFYRGLDVSQDPTFFLRRQGLGVLLGTVALLAAFWIKPRTWLRWAPYLYLGCLVLLALVLTQPKINGARRWFAMPFVGSVQPSELAKIIVPLFVAWCYHRFGIDSPRGVTSASRYQSVLMVCVGLVGALVFLQPDYGTGVFLLTVSGCLLLVGGIPVRLLRNASLVMVPGVCIMFLMRQEVVRERLNGLFNPTSVFQVDQSLAGLQAGGWWGSGLGLGLQKAAIPYQYTDFIFAVVGEELGFLGVLGVLLMLSVLLHTGARIVTRCPDPALRLVALAIVVNIVLQSCINIAVATASAPTKGIGLPFASYGSSSLTVLLLQVGILLSIARLHRRESVS